MLGGSPNPVRVSNASHPSLQMLPKSIAPHAITCCAKHLISHPQLSDPSMPLMDATQLLEVLPLPIRQNSSPPLPLSLPEARYPGLQMRFKHICASHWHRGRSPLSKWCYKRSLFHIVAYGHTWTLLRAFSVPSLDIISVG